MPKPIMFMHELGILCGGPIGGPIGGAIGGPIGGTIIAKSIENYRSVIKYLKSNNGQ